MKIKDIVNRDLVNLQNCESEPIHIPGSIQPHGFLVGINVHTYTIEYCSGNTMHYIGVEPSKLLSQPSERLFGDQQMAFEQYIAKQKIQALSPLKLNIYGRHFFCSVHQSNDIFIVEAEPICHNPVDFENKYDQTAQFLSYMQEAHSLQQLCQLVADGTRRITGYDRVMIYRFDKDYNGEVFAESHTHTIEPFLGLHYPHTDIPVQARTLYMQNLLRLICDIDYEPVPVFTLDDGADKNLDMSLAILRSTSPIHVQYLQNMGVGATLTISLIHNKKLWGLIACHHYSAKNLTSETRLAATLQGHFITSQIDLLQTNEEYEVARKTNLALEHINALAVAPVRDSISEIVNTHEILELCNATSAAICFQNKVYSSQAAPPDQVISELGIVLRETSGNSTIATNKLAQQLPNHTELCHYAPGLIYHPLADGDFIIWFRPETQKEVNWAGDPTKAIVKDQNGLSPRNSFALWKQTVKSQSKPWLQPELNSAANYAASLQRQISLILLSENEILNIELNEQLRQTNLELENINWITTHDLQEPLRKIQLLASHVMAKDQDLSPAVMETLERINLSASRMQTLLIDILRYMKVRSTEASKEVIDLNILLQMLCNERAGEILEKSAAIVLQDLPLIEGNPVLVKQLFSNLLSNSLTFASDERHLAIRIYQSTKIETPALQNAQQQYLRIVFEDNGIGFDNRFNQLIFNIFTKLNNHTNVKMSGIGLAMCKKIMQNHDGFIHAEGSEAGARFDLYFPTSMTQD